MPEAAPPEAAPPEATPPEAAPPEAAMPETPMPETLDAPPLVGNEEVPAELRERIAARRAELGGRLLILGHHYQRDDVIAFADRRGDSLDLSLFAAGIRDVEFVVFCGVHFMAESADMLTPDSVRVLLPDLRAGCTMADMAAIDQVEDAWDVLGEATGERFTPITYINSTAALKAFVGREGGSVCTSSNAERIVQWALGQSGKLLFFPDQHLGRNTCAKLGIGLDEMVVYDPRKPDGGNPLEAYAKAKVVLWRGHCSVHQNFQPGHADFWRARRPGIQVVVHPECPHEVVLKADIAGSTKRIIEVVSAAPDGSAFAIGTEHHLVHRLAKESPGKFITSLAPFACQCSTMFRISPTALADSLDSIAAGDPRHIISVDAETTALANQALERMMALG